MAPSSLGLRLEQLDARGRIGEDQAARERKDRDGHRNDEGHGRAAWGATGRSAGPARGRHVFQRHNRAIQGDHRAPRVEVNQTLRRAGSHLF